MRFERRSKLLFSLESVALTDIIMNLFIFFFITFSFLATFRRARESQIDVELQPAAGAAAARFEGTTVAVDITKQGDVLLDRVPVTMEQLGARLRAETTGGVAVALEVRADAAVAHGRVVEVIDLGHTAGVAHLTIATELKR